MATSFDKRDKERVKTEAFYIQYKLVNDDNVNTVEVLNISAGGICFLRDSVLYKKDEVLILFPFQTRKVLLKGKVVRVEGREVAVFYEDKEEKIELFVKLFNDEYKKISNQNKTSIRNRESLFYHHENQSDYGK